jgi:antitoxin PrlF
MADATTLTIKGQVTVPREIRDRVGLKSGDKIVFTMLSDGTIVMRPKTRSLASLAGSLTRPGQSKVSIPEMNMSAILPNRRGLRKAPAAKQSTKERCQKETRDMRLA